MGSDEIILEVVDDRTYAWTIIDDYVVADRLNFGNESPHKFGVKQVHTGLPGEWWGIYLRMCGEAEKDEGR